MATKGEYNEDEDEDDPYQEVHSLLATIRYRKKLNNLKKKKEEKQDQLELPPLPDPSVPWIDSEEEEKKDGEKTAEELQEEAIRTKIKNRMSEWRQRKREEKLRLREEMKQKWEERMKSKYGKSDSSQLSLLADSPSSSQDDRVTVITSKSRRAEIIQKIKDRVIPMEKVFEEIRKNMEREEALQYEFLETIRILRGVNRDEFYKDVNDDQEKNEAETSSPAEEQTIKDELLGIKRIGARIDSRWPKGHKHFTKPKTDDNIPKTLQKLLEAAYDLHKDIKKHLHYNEAIHYRRYWMNRIGQIVKSNQQRNNEFEHWREKMMKIAYDEEFSKGKSKLFYFDPLPKIRSAKKQRYVDIFEERASPLRSPFKCNHSWSKQIEKCNVKRENTKTFPYTDRFYTKRVFDSRQRLENRKIKDSLNKTMERQDQAKKTLPNLKDDSGKKENEAYVPNHVIDIGLPYMQSVDKNTKKIKHQKKQRDKRHTEKKSDTDSDNDNQINLPKLIRKREKHKIISDTDEIPKLIDRESSDESDWKAGEAIDESDDSSQPVDKEKNKKDTSIDLMSVIKRKKQSSEEDNKTDALSDVCSDEKSYNDRKGIEKPKEYSHNHSSPDKNNKDNDNRKKGIKHFDSHNKKESLHFVSNNSVSQTQIAKDLDVSRVDSSLNNRESVDSALPHSVETLSPVLNCV